MRLGVWEIVLILVLALVLFGGNKLAGVGKALGQSIRDFKREVQPEGSSGTATEEKKEESDKA
jgi:sec-independent protein translocase protein TatA